MTTSFPKSRSASSLVYVLLTLAAISIVILTGVSALIASSRQRSALASADVATSMAESAVHDGLLRVNSAVLSVYGEYGTYVAQPYSLASKVRGFAPNTNCATLAAEGAAIDSDCPSYSLAIRKFVSASTYTYSSREFPNDVQVSLPILNNSGTMFMTLLAPPSVVTGMTYQLCNVGGCAAPVATTAGFAVVPGTTQLNLTVNYDPSAITHSNILRLDSNSGNFTISRGFTAIEATGIAPDGTVQRLLATVRLNDTVSPSSVLPPTTTYYRFRTANLFTAQGVCFPDANACR